MPTRDPLLGVINPCEEDIYDQSWPPSIGLGPVEKDEPIPYEGTKTRIIRLAIVTSCDSTQPSVKTGLDLIINEGLDEFGIYSTTPNFINTPFEQYPLQMQFLLIYNLSL